MPNFNTKFRVPTLKKNRDIVARLLGDEGIHQDPNEGAADGEAVVGVPSILTIHQTVVISVAKKGRSWFMQGCVLLIFF